LEMARGEFLLVFDADFVPPSDILHRMIHHFTDEEIGMVQARWGHLNRNDSLLTRIEAILLDGHFVVEHTARNRSGRFFNFNGTAGIWRRSCIESAGGWHFDTLTEDLDLSYRAQLAGWRFHYLPDIIVPAELPPTIEAFFSQQYRWTKGAVQTARKLLPAILRSALPPQVKREAVFHLTAHVAYPLLLLLGAMLFPTAVLRSELRSSAVMAVDLVILASTTLSIAAFYLTAEGKERRPWWKTLLLLPLLMAFGIGISVNNSRAVLDALLGGRGEFVRTPKFGPETKKAPLAPTSVGMRRAYVELGMLAYLSAGALYLAGRGEWLALPFLLLFLLGFLLVVLHLIPTRWRLAPIILA
ncbi:MAG: glycosyltransferase, partial [Deltaproteobacteria bacterium]